ncbi:hypothetical protein HYX17_04810, partial [Candidatus Woesearchaeota archaeon]|nr:hypothetical protein [Candidatus Woesearchaeota archaeon]
MLRARQYSDREEEFRVYDHESGQSSDELIRYAVGKAKDRNQRDKIKAILNSAGYQKCVKYLTPALRDPLRAWFFKDLIIDWIFRGDNSAKRNLIGIAIQSLGDKESLCVECLEDILIHCTEESLYITKEHCYEITGILVDRLYKIITKPEVEEDLSISFDEHLENYEADKRHKKAASKLLLEIGHKGLKSLRNL